MVDCTETVLSQANADAVVVLGGSMSIAFKSVTAGLPTRAAPPLADLFDDYPAVYAFLETEAKQLPGRAEAAGIAAAFVKSAEEHGVAVDRVMIGLREGPCYFTDRTNTPTLGQGEWARIEGTGTEERPDWDLKVLSAFLDSLDTSVPAPAATPALVPAAAADEDSPEPITVHVTAGATAALRQQRAKCLNAIVNEWHEDDGKEEPSPYWFRALRPAEEAFAILKTVVAANTRSTRGIGFSWSRDTPAKLVLPGKIIYGFSGSESAVAAAPGPAARGAHGRADPSPPLWPPPRRRFDHSRWRCGHPEGSYYIHLARKGPSRPSPRFPTRPCPPPSGPSATQ